MTTTTKIQKAINHIFAKPGCRSDELATVIECKPQDVYSYIKDAIHAGLIVACKIDRPGQSSVSEFRPSASAPIKAPDWPSWKKDQRAPAKPLKTQADPRRSNRGKTIETPAGGGEAITPAAADRSNSPLEKTPPEAAAVDAAQALQEEAAPVTAAAQPIAPALADEFECHLSHDGRLHIFLGEPHPVVKLTTDETRQLGKFLINTEPAWATQ